VAPASGQADAGIGLGMPADTDYEGMATRYDRGRALPLEWLDEWRAILAPYLTQSDLPVLDVGSGTGLWAEVLTTWFQSSIVGVEPSRAMRREAVSKGLPSHIALVGGTAERIPLRDGTCSCAWLSTVLHHISDLRACARELRRVLRSEGVVLIRNSFGDRLDDVRWLDFFPPARDVAARRWPTVQATVEVFEAERFGLEAVHTVPEVVAGDLRGYYERIRVRANSTLTLISDEDFAHGLAQLENEADQSPQSGPVVDGRVLLVFRWTLS
jgi:ubiquinone/menaquinone biosynthesis C-methylase UbiE